MGCWIALVLTLWIGGSVIIGLLVPMLASENTSLWAKRWARPRRLILLVLIWPFYVPFRGLYLAVCVFANGVFYNNWHGKRAQLDEENEERDKEDRDREKIIQEVKDLLERGES